MMQSLLEWTVRSSILILGGALLLWALRVKDASVRLAAWTAVLLGSLAIPVVSSQLPVVPLAYSRVSISQAPARTSEGSFDLPAVTPMPTEAPRSPKLFDWAQGAMIVYGVGALALLFRLTVGIAISLRMLRASRATGKRTHGIDVRESGDVSAPVTLGVLRPAIVLPPDWNQWNEAKLDAVLAHERAHVDRRDPVVQFVSSIHRALLWHNPLSWFLHTRIVRDAEEASDNAALAVTDRALYARVLLDFIERGVRKPRWIGVSMARYGSADQRIHRVLEGGLIPRGATRWSVAAITIFALPAVYVAAAARPQVAVPPPIQVKGQTPAPAQLAPPPKEGIVSGVVNGILGGVVNGVPQTAGHVLPPPPENRVPKSVPGRLVEGTPLNPAPSERPHQLLGLGSVTAATVTVRPQIEGQLMSVSFKEGAQVQAGDVLATVDARFYQLQLEQVQAELERDKGESKSPAWIKLDQAKVEEAKLRLSNAYVRAPISGVLGLRMVDPGNFVHPSDGIVVITQLQPIAVVFTVAEDLVPKAMALLKDGAGAPAEVWNRDMSKKIAVGRLTAIDNTIDKETGTVKLKATFENKDGALYPSQFVLVCVP